MVRSFAQTICLKNDPAGVAEYKRYHANSFPEVLRALTAVGITKMKIYMTGNRLFMFFEAIDSFDPVVGASSAIMPMSLNRRSFTMACAAFDIPWIDWGTHALTQTFQDIWR